MKKKQKKRYKKCKIHIICTFFDIKKVSALATHKHAHKKHSASFPRK